MPGIAKWVSGFDADGTPLDPAKVAIYRAGELRRSQREARKASALLNVSIPRPDHNKKPKPHSVQLPICVIIPCHNYGHHLAECLDSVLAQTVRPAEIVVVDDSSTDNTAEVAAAYADRGVRYLRCEVGNAFEARRMGIRNTESQMVCCLDADDIIPPTYLEAAAGMLTEDNIGVVWTDFVEFGDRSGPRELVAGNIEVANYIHSAALCRRVALEITGVYDGPAPDTVAHEDWFVWRELLQARWKAVKSPVPLHYRRHGESRMANRGQQSFYDEAALNLETIDVVILASGRREWWPRLKQWLETQSWPLEQMRLIIASNADAEFQAEVRQWMNTLPVASTTFIRMPGEGSLADADRIASEANRNAVNLFVTQMYNAAIGHIQGRYAFFVEDDICPQSPDAIEQLLRRMDHDVAAVSGIYRSRFNTDNVHGPKRPTQVPGIYQVPWTGFGCLVARTSFLRTTPLHHGGTPPWFDWTIGKWAKDGGWKWLIDESVTCLHQNLEPAIPQKRTETTPPTFLQKMVNYAASQLKHAKNGFQVASEAEIARRLSICEQCPKFVAHACQVCGCNCSSNGSALRNKLASASATCPHPDGARW